VKSCTFMPVRLASLVVFVLVLALVGAGCGGGDEAAEEPDVVATETTTTETATDETTTETSELEGLASEECLQLVSIGAAISQAFSGAGMADDETSELFQKLVAKAPEEIKDDLETVAGAYAEYADALADLDLKAGEVPSADDLQKIQAAIGSIDQAEVQAAAERLSAWAEENC
jgi:hypothetical protein